MEFASDDPSPLASENSRVRRMISNRESARRSRLRKQRHVEDLRRRAGQLRIENRALADQILAVSGANLAIRHQNELLRRDSAVLHRRLSDIRRIIFLRQLHRLLSQLAATVDPPFS